MEVVVIGAGAAGFFAAICIAEKHPDYQVTILEKSNKLLQKVKVSGGGRCNVTNSRSKPAELTPFYPRGGKKLHSLFKSFSTNDMVMWLAGQGVATKTEEDLRVFPITDSSQTIIDAFLAAATKHTVRVETNTGVSSLSQLPDHRWEVHTTDETLQADKIVFATGSSPAAWSILKDLGLEITDVVPSLFTFKIDDPRLKDLAGISFPDVRVKVVGSKLTEQGPLLITHQGTSGPAVLKLSSWGAYELHGQHYRFEVLINYTRLEQQDQIKEQLLAYKSAHPKRKVIKYPLFNLPRRFWERMLFHCQIAEENNWGEITKKQLNKLVEELGQGRYCVEGKNTFKEEFVTAGGVALHEMDLKTFECKRFPGLYLAGEVLDIDALTGGFNFQACWSVGWVISECI